MNAPAVAKRVGRAALAVALVAFVAVFVIQAVPGVVGAEHSYVVLSNSMSPEINPGDTVIVGATDPAAIETGDVITFEREADQPPVTHRVVDVRRGDGGLAFKTAGDNNEGPDPGTVPASAVIGTVWFTIPLLGHVVQFANQPAGAAVLIGAPIALLVLSELWSRSGPTTVRRAGDAADDVETSTVATSPSTAGTATVDDRVLPRFDDADQVADADAARPDDAVSISISELRLGALGFGTFAIYATYVAVREPTGVSVGVAVGATIAAAFHLAGLALFVLSGDGEASGSPADPSGTDVATGNHRPTTDDPLGGGADD